TELLNRLKKQYIERNTALEEAKKKVKKLRQKLAEAEVQRENYEKQMDIIKTQREYEALDKEIKDAIEKEQQCRKEILKEEKGVDELVYSLGREEMMIKEQELELQIEQDKIKDESQEKQKLLESLTHEEADIVPGLDGEILFKFERIIKSKSGLGIVPVKGSVCTGCHMILPAQFVNEVRVGEKILFCPYCSRILFYQPSDEEAAFFHDEDAGSLADLAEYDETEE
ncbi:MAG: C4-type zinc ribbon domain-containing protein, partial [Spirochaetota bacterium]